MNKPLTPLAKQMLALADEGHPRAEELRERAEVLEDAFKLPHDDTRHFLAAWAKARQLWSEVSGEPLV